METFLHAVEELVEVGCHLFCDFQVVAFAFGFFETIVGLVDAEVFHDGPHGVTFIYLLRDTIFIKL